MLLGSVEPRFTVYDLPEVPWGSWTLVKSPRPPADPAHMLAVSLSTDVWLGVGFIAAVTVVACLATISNILRYEIEFIRVVAGVKKLRDSLKEPIKTAEVQEDDQAKPAAGGPEMAASPSPMPVSAETAETESIIDTPPEPESESEPEAEAETETEPITDTPVDAGPDADTAQAA